MSSPVRCADAACARDTAAATGRTVATIGALTRTSSVGITRAHGVTPCHPEYAAARRQSDGRTAPHDRYAGKSACGYVWRPALWLKTTAWLSKVKLRGFTKIDWLAILGSSALNLRRLTTLIATPARLPHSGSKVNDVS